MTISEYKEYVSRDNPGFHKTRKDHIEKISPNILEEIGKWIKQYNLSPLNFQDSLKFLLNEVKVQPTCKMCGKLIYYGYLYCSNECRKKDTPFLLQRTRDTLLKKNGSSSPLGSPEAMEKRKNTCKQRYGVEHPSMNKGIKERIRNTNIETYKSEEVRKNLSKSLLKAHEENGEKILERRKQTNFEKYGEYKTLPTKTIEKTKKTLEEKYGVDSPFKIHKYHRKKKIKKKY